MEYTKDEVTWFAVYVVYDVIYVLVCRISVIGRPTVLQAV